MANTSINRKCIHKEQIMEKVLKSEVQMISMYRRFMVKQESLRDQICRCTNNLQDTRKINLQNEKKLRAQRLKTENQYIEMLAKYDNEIGARHISLEALMAECDALGEEKDNLQNKLEELKILYFKLKEEKENFLAEMLKKKVDNFIRNRAARIIQRSWRIYYEKSCVKKKKKSKKK